MLQDVLPLGTLNCLIFDLVTSSVFYEILKLTYPFCMGNRFPEKIGGNLPGVHYIRDVADADSLISSLVILLLLCLCYIIDNLCSQFLFNCCFAC